MEQGTQEWLQSRCGKVTASRIADMVAKTKTGWGASRFNYMAELIVERLTGIPQEGYVSKPMMWGTETEPEARAAYEFFSGLEVVQVGFVQHPKIEMAGASPDSYVGKKGLVEIKCPNSSTHIDTLLGGSVPDKYFLQMQFQMACTEREWCDFVSYDPRMPEDLKLYVYRVQREDHHIDRLETEAVAFLKEINDKVAQLNALRLALPEQEAA
jgi:putative phage-type endonuclease